ncbi:MAG: hypothetical protein CV087_10350 [Candidatus Brocadia sp. WS118]|nr:MAG: hypothetical protein CV087_10350 [Candidatus Brocadia sp. WS118]
MDQFTLGDQMKIIIFLLSFIMIGKGQILNETFSDFVPDSSGMTAFWVFDSLWQRTNGNNTIGHDASGNGHSLSASGFSIGDQLTGDSPLYVGGNTQNLISSSNNYFSQNDAGLNANTSDLLILALVKVSDYTGQVISRYSAGGGIQFRMSNSSNNGKGLTFIGYDGTTSRTEYNNSTTLWTYSEWVKIAVLYHPASSGANIQAWVNNTEVSLTVSGGDFEDISTTTGVRIGQVVNVQYFNGYIAAISYIINGTWDKAAKEYFYLANGWRSKNGDVIRNAFAFNQGIVADTIFRNISTVGAAVGRVDAWGASGGETLTIFNKAGDSQSFELTTDSTRYIISSITFAADDSVYFSAGAGETLYIDNVYLEASPATANIYANKFSAFPEFPDFINDEAIQ